MCFFLMQNIFTGLKVQQEIVTDFEKWTVEK